MPSESHEFSPNIEKKVRFRPFSREEILLAEQSMGTDIRILPGTMWGLHYKGGNARAQILSGLLEGRLKSTDVNTGDLKPDAVIFNAQDIAVNGLQNTLARLRDTVSYVAGYDYGHFAKFAEGLSGTGIDVAGAQKIYDAISQSRSRKKALDAFGRTGQAQIEEAIRNEVWQASQQIKNLPRIEKILEVLKMDWISERLKLVGEEKKDEALSQLSGDERELFQTLREQYLEYIDTGSDLAYENLISQVKKNVPRIKTSLEKGKISESMRKLEEELKPFMDKVDLPGTPDDPGIPPEDQDEYHTPAPSEMGEKGKPTILFEITPKGTSNSPLVGYFGEGRKSYFDIDTKTWSKKKQVTLYTKNLSGEKRQIISGTVNAGVKAIPMPNGYALDAASLNFKGEKPEIFRDQNGCFYLRTNGLSTFSIDFLREEPAFIGSIIPEDTASIYRGNLSDETEKMLARLTGSSVQKAEKIRQYLLAHHFYPGGGDLMVAQALQYKLRNVSTGNNYVQNLDVSEYLECYSASTLFIAILRKAGIPARLVIGHKVESTREGKAVIDSASGHVWAEIWDGKIWRRFDATPSPKPEDKKEKGDKTQKSGPSENAEDGGAEKPQDTTTPSDSQQFGQASDQDVEDAENNLKDAHDTVEKADAQKQSLDQKIDEAKSFKDVEKLREEIPKTDLFEDMQDDLDNRIQSKEEQLKDELKEKIEEMSEDGFLDEQKRDELEKKMDEKDLKLLDELRQEIERENSLYNEYQKIKEEAMPLVDEWYKYFVERLPKEQEVDKDEDSLTRQGAFDRHSVMKPRNLLFGTIKNPRMVKPSIKPKFIASAVVDISGSMGGEKLKSARKLLVFFNELFSRIEEDFGYIRSANYVFSDTITLVKSYDQKYDSSTRYDFGEGKRSTVKLRLMQKLKTTGGTNMLPAIQKAAQDLNQETFDYPDYASALYFLGDGGDTSGNAKNIKQFLSITDSESGFGEHMLSAVMLGNESQRRELAAIFGDEHTTVAPDFDSLIEQTMENFDRDIQDYLKNKVV